VQALCVFPCSKERRREIMKKFVVGIALAALLLASCAPAATPEEAAPVPTEEPTALPEEPTAVPEEPTAAPEEEEVTITVWMMPLTDDYAATLAPYVKDFEEKNPGIKVDLTVIPWKDSLQKMVTAFQANAAPDVMYTSINRIIVLEDAGALLPLDEYADEEYKAKLKPGLLESQGMWKDHVYGVPFTAYGRALYYNADIFENAGITAPPTNWEEFRAAAKAVTGDGVYAFSLSGTDNWLDDYRVWLHQAGGRWLSEDGTKCAVNSPEAVEAFGFLVDMALEDEVMYPGSGTTEVDNFGLFASGATAMIIQSNYIAKLGETSEVNFETAPIPQYEGHEEWGLPAAEILSINSTTEHPDEAWKFLEYFSTDPHCQLHHNQEITFFPTVVDIDFPLDDPKLQAHVTDTMLPEAPVVLHPRSREIIDLVRNELNKAFLGEVSVQEALDTACAQVDELLAEE
jgi:multiple sugar transport system substrate-binding protein